MTIIERREKCSAQRWRAPAELQEAFFPWSAGSRDVPRRPFSRWRLTVDIDNSTDSQSTNPARSTLPSPGDGDGMQSVVQPAMQ